MVNHTKYSKGYFMPPEIDFEWAKKEYPDHAPIWCSVDLRDGNQSLIIPMSLDEKVEFYKTLVKVGFKEIEVGFPAASDTEYALLRKLIEEDLIPNDVTVQVLTQAREHIIKKTFEALEGAKNAIVHVYNSTSLAQREQVFRMSKDEIKQIAVDGAKLLLELTEKAGADYRFEYSPESFTGTEPEYALEVCNAVLDVWQPVIDRKPIINIPVTVEMSMPHIYAMQVAYINKNLKYRDKVVLSLHPHNDRGCGVADSELGLLAGADRIEGTLFGNGERTGNVDIVTLAMNMFALGVDPKLDFTNMPEPVNLMRAHLYSRRLAAVIKTPLLKVCIGARKKIPIVGLYRTCRLTRTTLGANMTVTLSESTVKVVKAALVSLWSNVTELICRRKCAKILATASSAFQIKNIRNFCQTRFTKFSTTNMSTLKSRTS